MIEIVADLHTHTSVSQHAYSSLREMVMAAKRLGHCAIAITDHGPGMEDGAHRWHFQNLNLVPKEIEGVRVIRGVEYNTQDEEGNLDDVDPYCFRHIEFGIASFHEGCFPPQTEKQHTATLEKLLNNPAVHMFGHLGNPHYEFDHEYIISQCNNYGKIVEINNNSPKVRQGSEENCMDIAKLCMKYGVPISIDTDAHIEFMVGHVEESISMLESIHFPEELIVNSSKERMETYFERIGVSLFV